DVDLRVGVRVVEVAAVDVHVDAAERVHGLREAVEVDVDDVVDLQSRVELADRAHGQARAAERVGGVELVGAVAGDVDLQVARQRQQGGGALRRVEAHQDHRVRERLADQAAAEVARV